MNWRMLFLVCYSSVSLCFPCIVVLDLMSGFSLRPTLPHARVAAWLFVHEMILVVQSACLCLCRMMLNHEFTLPNVTYDCEN